MEVFIKKNRGFIVVFCLVFLLFALITVFHEAEKAYGGESEVGKKVYNKYCVICHGAKGDGKGLIGIIHRFEKRGMVWTLYPRDFTVGVFKFRTTPTGCLPTNDDLLKIVDVGISRAYMPSHKDISLKEKKAVIAYIKTFSKRWEEEEPCESLPIKKPAFVGSAKSVAKGKKLWKDMKCYECHGAEGKGDGPKSDKLKDDWGDPIMAFDFTSGATKMGFAPENIYIAYTTGLDGSGMPSYEDSMNEEDRWHLVSYTLKLMGRVK